MGGAARIAAFEAALRADLDRALVDWPARLAEATRYMLGTGGKRVRPQLAQLGALAVGGQAAQAMPFALAVEYVHTYSLVHDDLPAMDDDDLRRGQPSCHRAFDEATAILVGDALLTLAFEVLARGPGEASLQLALSLRLARAAGGAGMVGGQVLDLGGDLRDLAALEAMQRAKTGAIIEAALVGGAEAAGATAAQRAMLSRCGAQIGLLFQITDDLLDEAQDAERQSNSYLHHLPKTEVRALAERTAQSAHAAIEALGPAADDLRALITQLAVRSQ